MRAASRYPIPRSSVLWVSLLFLGCQSERPTDAPGDEAEGPAHVVSRESDGIETRNWTVDGTPDVEIGVVDGDSAYLFSQITGLERLRDGRILVVDQVSRELRFFDEGGRHLRSVGGSGEGPGEYLRPRLLRQLPDDTLLVWDDDLRRLSLLDVDGGWIEILDTRVQNAPVEPRPWAAFDDGTLLTSFPGETSPESVEDGEILQDTFRLWTLLPGSGVRQPFADRPAALWQYIDHPTRPEMLLIPFTTTPRFAVAGSVAAITFGTHPGVQLMDQGGDVVREMSVDRPPRPVLQADIDRVSELSRRDLDPNDQPLARRRMDALPYPETMPRYDRVMRTEDDRIWARHFFAEGDEAPVWDLFTMSGEFLGTLTTPEGLEVYQVGSDWILGVHFDELDLPIVRMHRIRTE